MQLNPVHPDCVAQVWPTVRPLVIRALNRAAVCPSRGIELIEEEMLSGKMFLWVAHVDDVIFAAITMKISGDLCEIVTCAGARMKEFLPLWGAMEDFARERGCKRVIVYGRQGWRRVLSGYRTKMLLIEKKL